MKTRHPNPWDAPMLIVTCLILIVWLLSGCAINNPPRAPGIPPVINMPVQVPCIASVPEKPKLHTDAEMMVMDDYTLAITLLVDRIKREIYESRLEAALDGCR